MRVHMQSCRKMLTKMRVHMRTLNGRAPPPVEGEKKGEREEGKRKKERRKRKKDKSYKQTNLTTKKKKQPTLTKTNKA